MSNQKENIVNVALEPADKAVLDKIVKDRSMVQKQAIGRILRWFVERDHLLQNIILGIEDEIDEYALLNLLVERHAGYSSQAESPEDADEILAESQQADQDPNSSALKKQKKKKRA